MKIVDHLVAREGVPARSGYGYDYVLAGDGVWVQTENAHLRLRVPAAACHVRGLPEVGGMCELAHGRIPPPYGRRRCAFSRCAASTIGTSCSAAVTPRRTPRCRASGLAALLL